MLLRQVLEIFEFLDKPNANGKEIIDLFKNKGNKNVQTILETVVGDQGSTDFVKVLIKGYKGKSLGGDAPTLGIIGRLGGIGARPAVIGFVSDGDGALAALSAALKVIEMNEYGDLLPGDVIVSTHICPTAPVSDHKPVQFMGSPIDMATANKKDVDGRMDAILSIDTTKGNRIINHNGIAISSTVKEGYILRTSDSVLDVMTKVTGVTPSVFAITQQDITPYGNGLYHLNSILQPCTATDAPVIGVAITTTMPVAGCASGASHPIDVELAARFAVEVAKGYGDGTVSFYDAKEYRLMMSLYGDLTIFQTHGNN